MAQCCVPCFLRNAMLCQLYACSLQCVWVSCVCSAHTLCVRVLLKKVH